MVVSPLIALMQDQAAQLEQMGIPAAALNSQISWPASTFEELTEVSGIGERKAQSFGKEVLTALHDFAAH